MAEQVELEQVAAAERVVEQVAGEVEEELREGLTGEPAEERHSPRRPVALVTGAARGIGRSAALAFGREGFDVVVNYSRSEAQARQVVAEVERCGVTALALRADVASDADVRAMVGAVTTILGRLDVLVSNAGTTIDTRPSELDALQVEEWDRVFAVNVRGVFLVARACAPLLRLSPIASMITTCSVAGLRPGPQPLPYAASKAAVANLTHTLAGALAPEIRVNGVAPGWMVGEWMEHQLGDDYDRLMERRARMTPLRRVATPDDVAEAMVSLALGNRFVTGQILVVDGGFTAVT
ncbi:MAG: SDR family NAD(P)-dependent oxidoreductase [Acidimicrobiales bacterium]